MDSFDLVVGLLGAFVGASACFAVLRRTISGLREENARLRITAATATHEAESTLRQLNQVAADRHALSQEFEAVAARALATNNQQFLDIADLRLRRAHDASDAELAQRHEQFTALVEPMNHMLEAVRIDLNRAELTRVQSQAQLQEQLTGVRSASSELRSQTEQLVNALRTPQVRGRWGELHLRRVVEATGLVEHVDFSEQVSVTTREGTYRPDLVVTLTDDRRVVVDAKVPLDAYLKAIEEDDPATRQRHLTQHARQLRTHIDQLASKHYWEHFGTAAFVVMFVPAEAFLDAALKADPNLNEYALRSQVLVATPTSLSALLQTVAHTWRQEALANNAAQVHRLGKELYGRLTTLGEHVAKLGRSLDNAVGAYNQAIGSLDRRVFVSARKLAELEGITDTLPELDNLDHIPRASVAGEWATDEGEEAQHDNDEGEIGQRESEESENTQHNDVPTRIIDAESADEIEPANSAAEVYPGPGSVQ